MKNYFGVRLPDALLEWLVAASEAADMHPSAFVRRVLEDAAERDRRKPEDRAPAPLGVP